MTSAYSDALLAEPLLAADDQPSTFMVLVLMAIGGLLVGGAWSVRDRSKLLAVVMGLAGLVAVAAAVLRMIPA